MASCERVLITVTLLLPGGRDTRRCGTSIGIETLSIWHWQVVETVTLGASG